MSFRVFRNIEKWFALFGFISLSLISSAYSASELVKDINSSLWTNQRSETEQLLDNENGTILSPITGLTWEQTGPSNKKEWNEAVSYCSDLDLAGYRDWHLPSLNELMTIVEKDRFNPASSSLFTYYYSHKFWTVTPSTEQKGFYAYVNFYDGSDGEDALSIRSYVRCVRGEYEEIDISTQPEDLDYAGCQKEGFNWCRNGCQVEECQAPHYLDTPGDGDCDPFLEGCVPSRTADKIQERICENLDGYLCNGRCQDNPCDSHASTELDPCPSRIPPQIQNREFCGEACQKQAFVHVNGNQLDICAVFSDNVDLVIGVASPDLQKIWYLNEDGELGKEGEVGQALRQGASITMSATIPEEAMNEGVVFWLTTERNFQKLDWENSIYDFKFFPVDPIPIQICNLAIPQSCGSCGPTELEHRLIRCKKLRDNIIWQKLNGDEILYSDWPDSMKERLNDFFIGYMQDQPIYPDYPELHEIADRIDIEKLQFYLEPNEAMDVFLAHVAHALYLEVEKLLPWSLTSRSDNEIQEILSSKNYFAITFENEEIDTTPSGILLGHVYQLLPTHAATLSSVDEPATAYKFMAGERSNFPQNLIAETEEETLANLTTWMRDHVVHGIGIQEVISKSIDYTRAFINMSVRLHRKKIKTFTWNQNSSAKAIIAMLGCHGAAALMHDIARGVNIPLKIVMEKNYPYTCNKIFSETHAGLAWHWETSDARYLPHMDDIYMNGDYAPTFGCTQSGPFTKSDDAMNYFQIHWVDRQTLENWGFVFDYHLVSPGQGYDRLSTDPERFPHLGYMLGYWKPTINWETAYQCRGCNFYDNSIPCDNLGVMREGDTAFLFHKRLMSNSFYNVLYFNRPEVLLESMRNQENFDLYQHTLPVRYWEDPENFKNDFFNQFEAILECYGNDLQQLQDIRDEWVSNRYVEE